MKNHKLLIIIVALIVVALGVYLYFSRSSTSPKTSSPTSTLVSSNTGGNPVPITDATTAASSFAGSDIATMLKNVSQIKLNTAILQHPSFLALVDTTLTLPPTVVSGRINPFGSSGGSTAVPATTQVISNIPTAVTQ